MTADDIKINPWIIVRAHRRTYVNAFTDAPQRTDNLIIEGLPLVVGALCGWFDVRLRPGASVGLLTVTGLLSAFLFGVMLQVSQRAMDWSDTRPERGKATTAHAKFLKELAANAGYAALVCIAAALAYVVSATAWKHGYALRTSSAIGLALGAHLVLVLLMVMKRVFALVDERLGIAETRRNDARGTTPTAPPHGGSDEAPEGRQAA